MHTCVNHPGAAAQMQCAACYQPLCPACSVEFLGVPHCAACRHRRVVEAQGANRRIYDRARRQATMSKSAAGVMAILLGPPALALILISTVAKGNLIATVILFLLALAACVVGMRLWVTPLSQLGNEQLRRDIGAKLTAQGIPQAAESGLFVGIAPGEERKTYDGDSHWDVGFLLMGPGWMAYYGDQAHFSLRPDQVTSLVVEPDKKPGLFTIVRLKLNWHDARTGLAGTMSIMATCIRSREQSWKDLQALRDRIEAWRTEAPPAPVNAGWPLPPVSAPATATLPAAAANPTGFLVQTGIGMVLAVAVGVGLAVIKLSTGVKIPIWGPIIGVIVASQFLSNAVLNRRK